MEVQFSLEQLEAIRKYKVIVLYSLGCSYSEIQERTQFLPGTISKLIHRFLETDDVLETKHENAGRPRILNNEAKELIITELTTNDRATSQDLADRLKIELNLEVSSETVRRFQKEIGRFILPRKSVFLKPQHKIERLDFCRNHLDTKFSNWVFVDESSFVLVRRKRKVFVLKSTVPPDVYEPNPHCSIMIWGAISRKGKIAIDFVNGTLNQQSYLQLISKHLPIKADRIFGHHSWNFMQDSAPAHRGYQVQEWLVDNMPRVIKQPSCSPDLNPIELVWKVLKEDVEAMEPKNAEDLKLCILEAWNNLTVQFINGCINHLYNVIPDIIRNKGNFSN